MKNGSNDIFSKTVNTIPEDHLKRLHDGLASAVSFGVDILVSDFERGGTDLDLPILLFLRNLISTVDGIAVLAKNAIIEPANNLLRTALENFLSIEYLLEDDQLASQRSASFMVWFFSEQQRWLKKGDINTAEYQELVKKHKRDKAFNHIPVMVMPMADEQWKKHEAIFNMPDYKNAKAEYDRVKIARKRSPMWYHLYGGPTSIEELASRVGYPAVYEMLYRGLSISSHGNNILSGKLYFDEEDVARLADLRDSYGAESIVNHSMNICKMAYRTIVTKRVPFMADSYNHWLKENSGFNKYVSAIVQENIDQQNEAMIRWASKSGNHQ